MRRRRHRRVSRLLTLVAALVIAVPIGWIGWLLLVYSRESGPGTGREVRVVLEPDIGFAAVLDRLVEEGVVGDARWFAFYARIVGGDERMRHGLVVLRDDEPPRDVLRRISAGFPAFAVRLTIPEGFTRFDIARRVSELGICTEESFLAASEDPQLLAEYGIDSPSFESYLFPDTYSVRQTSEPRDVIARMVQNLDRRLERLWAEHASAVAHLSREFGWDRGDILNLASIVEKEAAVAEEQAIIAGVFLNRLRSAEFRPARRLQADPTVSYGCLVSRAAAPSCRDFDGRITQAMLRDSENRYNTYRHAGLPPGAIANPGLDAIRAVLDPAQHSYLFFVVKGGGRHEFSETHEEHARAVARYRNGS